MKIAVLLPNWIGDVVMATPTLRALRKKFNGQDEILGVMRPYVAKVLDGTAFLNHTLFYDRTSSDANLRTPAVLRQLRHWQPDTMLLLTNSFRGATLAWRAGAKERVGYARNGRGFLLTTSLAPPREEGKLKPISAIDYFLQLAYAVGCPHESPQMELATLKADEDIAGEIWHRLGLRQARRVVVFNTGSAVGSARSWPQDYYVALARRIVEDSSNAVLVICGPGERDTAAEIERQTNHPRVKSMANQDLSLGVAKACIRRSDLMVTTDSGPRHFAPAFGVATIVLSGPIDPRWSESHHEGTLSLQHAVDCGPCGKTVCPFDHHQCMRGLDVGRVLAAVQEKLAAIEIKNAA